MTAGYNPHAGGVVKEYTPADIIIQDANGNPLTVNAANFVFRLTRIGKLNILEFEFQGINFAVNTTFFQIFLPVEFNAKDPNPIAYVDITSGANPVFAAAVLPNVVNPTVPSGNNPVTLFIEPRSGANFIAAVVDLFCSMTYTAA